MKKFTLFLSFVALICTPVMARVVSQAFTSVTLDTFKSNNSHIKPTFYGPKTASRGWGASISPTNSTVVLPGSKTSPLIMLMPNQTPSLFQANKEGSLGLLFQFKSKGYHFISIFPTQAKSSTNQQEAANPLIQGTSSITPAEKAKRKAELAQQSSAANNSSSFNASYVRSSYFLPGHVQSLSVWAWGSDYDYDLYVMLKDAKGYSYRLYMGRLNFDGWKKLIVDIPSYIQVSRAHNIKNWGLHFQGFLLTTTADADVGPCYLYLSHFMITTNMSLSQNSIYDGSQLAQNSDLIDKLWAPVISDAP